MLILGIESSCDETGVALFDKEHGLLHHKLHSQIKSHAIWGGVVPEIASRDHSKMLLPLIQSLMTESGKDLSELDGIAYTQGPGLIGCLMVGAMVARSLAYGLKIPSLGVHHMEGHLLAPFIDNPNLKAPFLALLVSGGHTQIIAVEKLGQYKLIGESIDDAVGEAFDKTAKILGLGYPGGPALAKLAESGDPNSFELPKPMIHHPTCDMSFSGLKTAVIQAWQQCSQTDQDKANLAASFEKTAVETLVHKTLKALKQTGLKQVIIAGGVSANKTLRNRFEQVAAEQQFTVTYPRMEFCTDNGAMIALTGYLRFQSSQKDDSGLKLYPRWSLDDLKAIHDIAIPSSCL